MLGALLASDDHGGFSDEEIVDFLVALLVAGYETTSTTMTLAVKFLTETPLALAQVKVSAVESRPPLLLIRTKLQPIIIFFGGSGRLFGKKVNTISLVAWTQIPTIIVLASIETLLFLHHVNHQPFTHRVVG